MFYLFFCFLFFWPQGVRDLSSLTRDWTYISCTVRQNPNHCTIREVPWNSLIRLKFEVIFQNLLLAFFPMLAIRFQGFLISCCCCPFAKLCPPLRDPMNCSMWGFPVLHYLLESAQTLAHSWTVIDLKHSERKVFIYQLFFSIFVYWTHYNIYDNFMPEFPSKAAKNFSLFLMCSHVSHHPH